MKYLIIGLGNPGTKYANTRHNIGFKVLDELASFYKGDFTVDKYAEICEISFKGRKLILVKPNTFMNLSGKAIQYWLQRTKIDQDRMLVVTDDITLPFGALRLRKKGSYGGHNGLRDIQDVLGHSSYARLRFGVGNDFQRGCQAEYVLSNFTVTDCESMEERISKAIKMVKGFVTVGIERTMSDLNGK